MRKRLLMVFCSIVMLTTFAGCSGQQEAAGLSETDLSLTVAGQTFDCDTNIETVIDALGEDYDYAEGKSCAYDGLDKTYGYEMTTFYTNPLEAGDIVTEIYTQDSDVTTTRGISVGASRQQVLDAYGEPDEDDGYTLYYRVSEEPGEPSLCFDMEGDTVFAIFLTRGLI